MLSSGILVISKVLMFILHRPFQVPTQTSSPFSNKEVNSFEGRVFSPAPLEKTVILLPSYLASPLPVLTQIKPYWSCVMSAIILVGRPSRIEIGRAHV